MAEIFVSKDCPHCNDLKEKLSKHTLTCPINIIDINKNPEMADKISDKDGMLEVPTILSNGKEIDVEDLIKECT